MATATATKRSLDTVEAAAYLGVTPKTLANWRYLTPRKGPRFVRTGGLIRYRIADLDAYQAANTQ